MCTSVKYKNICGRNLDLQYPLDNKVAITPRNYLFNFRHTKEKNKNGYAIIGMALVIDDYPLYFDAMNEHGLFVAGLNFEGYASYFNVVKGKTNICSFELIPYILRKCKNINEVRKILKNVNITKTAFSKNLAPSPLHWQVADKNEIIVIEQTTNGLTIYDNPYQVLTNNPEFSYHAENIKKYINTKPDYYSGSKFANGLEIKANSNGIGTSSLPGGLNSQDRFIRAAFTCLNSISKNNEIDEVNQFFHILKSVEQTRGQVICLENLYEITLYSSAISSKTLTYYYTTYDNSQINAIKLNAKNINLDNNQLFVYELANKININYQN